MSKPYQDSAFSTTKTRADPLEALARQGTRQMLQAALEAKVAEHLQRQRYERGACARGYRNGYLPRAHAQLGQWRGERQRVARER